jgi:hypothetical protein
MKTHRYIAAAAASFALFTVGSAQTVDSFSLTHGGWTYSESNLISDGTQDNSGSTNFENQFGVDNMFQNWWWFNTDNSGREFALGNQVSGGTTSSSSARLVYVEDAGPNAPDALQFDIEYTLTSLPGGTSAIVQIGFKVHNLSDSEQHVRFFSYSDFDLNETSGDDSGTFIAPNQFQITDGDPQVYGGLVASVSGLNGWEQSTFADLRNKLTDSDIDTLSNATSPFGPTDMTHGFVWDFTLQANGTANGADQFVGSLVKYVNNPVPEPSTIAVLGIAAAGLLARRRRK